MCVVSNIGEIGKGIWPKSMWPQQPWKFPQMEPWRTYTDQTIPAVIPAPYNGPTKTQFEEFLELMRAARKFDKAMGQADCPSEDKTGWLRDLAKFVGVDPVKVDEILKAK